jgi:hypothetical protein
MRRTNTRPSMLNRLVTNAELAQIMPHHLWLDLHLVELLAAVNPNHTADHLRHDDHVTQVCLDQVGFLIGFGVLLGLAEFLNQAHGAAFETAVESAAGTGMENG